MCKSIKIFSVFVFMLFLISMQLWIGWNGQKSNMLALFGIGILVVKIFYKIPFDYSKRNFLLCLSFYVGYILLHPEFGYYQFLTQIPPQLLPVICVVYVRDIYKKDILDNITKWFAYLMLISLGIYVLSLFVQLPYLWSMKYSASDRYGVFQNYFFYVKEVGGFDGSFPRFGGPFLEPGYLGMIGSFLVMANKYDLKNIYNRIIILSILASFSLAGWLLLFIGYLLTLFYNKKLKLSRVIFLIFGIYFSMLFFNSYNGGDNLVNNEILSRLEFDSEGNLTGNNRTSLVMLEFYSSMMDGDLSLLLHGYPSSVFKGYEEWELVGTGFEGFFVHHGILGIIYVFFFYFLVIIYSRDKRFAILFFILIILCFWQRAYALWISWLICYFYSCVVHDNSKI